MRVIAPVLIFLAAQLHAQLPPLDIHLVGDYGFCPWDDVASITNHTSRAHRLQDMNFGIRNIWVRDQATVDKLDLSNIRKEIEAGWKMQPKRTMIVRVDFWGPGGTNYSGHERFEGNFQPPEVYRDRLGAVLTQLEPVLSKVQGVSLSEENVPYRDRTKVLKYLYEWASKKYPHTRFFQWWTPNTAVPGFYEGMHLSADGWVVDPYSLCPRNYPNGPSVKRLVQKYLVTGKPLVFVLSVSNEQGLQSLFPDVLNDQLRVCYDFNLPTIFYWTYQRDDQADSTTLFGYPTGNALMDKMSERVFEWSKQVRATPQSYRGNAREMDTWDNPPLKVKLTPDKTLNAIPLLKDDFTQSTFLDQCSGEGFRDLFWNGRELCARGFDKRRVNVQMTYHIMSDKPMKWPHVSLNAQVDPRSKGIVRLAISRDTGKTWVATAETTRHEGTQPLMARTWFLPEFVQCNEMWVRIELLGEAGSDERPTVRIDDLSIWSSDSETKTLQE